MKERTVITAVLAAVLIVVVGLVKPRPDDQRQATKVTESCFYAQKTFGEQRADVVILGDSRALRGLSPTEMAEFLPGQRILNLAYNAGGLNDEMYDFGESRLDLESVQPTVILALTPLTLLDWKSANGHFRTSLRMPRDQRLLQLHAPELAEFFAPVRPSDLVRMVWKYPLARYWQLDYQEDGWLATSRSPADTTEALDIYKQQLADSVISPDLVATLERRITRWTAQGIRVVVFRMPAQPSMDELENTMLAFDETDLARRIATAGGDWLAVPRAGWRTYDGSHLDQDDARRLSRLVGKFLGAEST